MNKIVILPLAKQDIKEAASWYNSKQKGLGKRFTKQARQTISALKLNPLSFAIRYDDVRTIVMEVFPYMVHYQFNEREKVVIVSAVLHTSRNPDIWVTDRENPDIVD